jgi:hypothetical protein
LTVLILEDNLLWSSRLRQSVAAAGHDPVVSSTVQACDVAILALNRTSLAEDVASLRSLGAFVMGHAGHKEKALLEAGREAGCDRLVTNGELAHKLPQILEAIASRQPSA